MKTQFAFSPWLRGSVLALIGLGLGASTSCMTTYDANGRPVQSVDPAVAVAGAAAAGIAGYAIANSNDHHHKGYYYDGGYHPRPHHRHHGYSY
ncbi:MAG: hypothetical protein RLZZ282_1733 [Verrucomicrobiota bacterium]|jgi:hypothetical protein